MKSTTLTLAAAAAIAILQVVTPAANGLPPDQCVQFQPSPRYYQHCLSMTAPTNINTHPGMDPSNTGMTNEQLKQCCLDGSCVQGGIDAANGKTIICDPLTAIGPGEEGFN